MALKPYATVEGVGRLVRRYRQRQHLTQAQLAEQAGVSRSFVVDLESGHEGAALGKTLAVLHALNAPFPSVLSAFSDEPVSAEMLNAHVDSLRPARD